MLELASKSKNGCYRGKLTIAEMCSQVCVIGCLYSTKCALSCSNLIPPTPAYEARSTRLKARTALVREDRGRA